MHITFTFAADREKERLHWLPLLSARVSSLSPQVLATSVCGRGSVLNFPQINTQCQSVCQSVRPSKHRHTTLATQSKHNTLYQRQKKVESERLEQWYKRSILSYLWMLLLPGMVTVAAFRSNSFHRKKKRTLPTDLCFLLQPLQNCRNRMCTHCVPYSVNSN